MFTTIHNPTTLGKLGALIFARQAPIMNAERHDTLLNRFRAWRERRAVAAELNQLSDRCLADIGLTRQGIDEMLRVSR
ncbi:MAG: DUF1127 domain-containing protein [Acidocella sp.]|uniref:DUF1127 domain-containing protein n=1 Tax=Acidocella sp. TaxID=50710 RepID=UPI003FBB21C5